MPSNTSSGLPPNEPYRPLSLLLCPVSSRPAWLLTCLSLSAPLALGACKHEPVPPASQPVATYPAPSPQPDGNTPAPATTAQQPPMPPAYGFFCASDSDLQCPFGRCIGGRCGGCSTPSDCKPNASCAASPFGMVCVGGVPYAPAPAPAPTPALPTTAQPPAGSDPFANARALCVQRANEYRSRLGARPLARSTATETCGDQQARSDAASSRPHGAFGACGEMAQNECPGWPGSPDQVVDSCLDMMFREGPGEGPTHGHYNNMVNPSYVAMSCGFALTPDGKLWVVQDFFR